MSNLILFPSTAERDRTFKCTLYANHGVNEYWIVDITAKDIIVLLLGKRLESQSTLLPVALPTTPPAARYAPIQKPPRPL